MKDPGHSNEPPERAIMNLSQSPLVDGADLSSTWAKMKNKDGVYYLSGKLLNERGEIFKTCPLRGGKKRMKHTHTKVSEPWAVVSLCIAGHTDATLHEEGPQTIPQSQFKTH